MNCLRLTDSERVVVQRAAVFCNYSTLCEKHDSDADVIRQVNRSRSNFKYELDFVLFVSYLHSYQLPLPSPSIPTSSTTKTMTTTT